MFFKRLFNELKRQGEAKQEIPSSNQLPQIQNPQTLQKTTLRWPDLTLVVQASNYQKEGRKLPKCKRSSINMSAN